MHKAFLLLLCTLLLAGCDQLGIETPAQVAAAREAEGRAVGGACRHSGRALEDCYAINPRASKAAIFGGWRDMDAYMRENNIAIVPAVMSPAAKAIGRRHPAEAAPAEAAPAETAAAANPAPAAH